MGTWLGELGGLVGTWLVGTSLLVGTVGLLQESHRQRRRQGRKLLLQPFFLWNVSLKEIFASLLLGWIGVDYIPNPIQGL